MSYEEILTKIAECLRQYQEGAITDEEAYNWIAYKIVESLNNVEQH